MKRDLLPALGSRTIQGLGYNEQLALPVDHLTRPALRTVSLTLSTEEQGQEYAISFDFTGPRIDDLLAAFPEPACEELWQWLEDPTTVGEHLQLSPTATLHTVEATLGVMQRGL